MGVFVSVFVFALVLVFVAEASPLSSLNVGPGYNPEMEKKIFWLVFFVLGVAADFLLPIWWGLAATIPIVFISWWVAYRSGWFE
ncbi:MAG: hypothetical protein ABSD39_17635 [Terriglobales bacterium]